MAKRNHIFIAARNRNSAGPMNSKKNDMIDEYHEAEKDEILLTQELIHAVKKLFMEGKDFETIKSILLKKYPEDIVLEEMSKWA